MIATSLLPLIALLVQPPAREGLPDLLGRTRDAAPPRLEARLLAAHESIQPGGQTELAVVLNIPDGWHIYHPIILATGAPTTVSFEAPAGVSFGELRYPTPRLGKDRGIEYLALDEEVIVLTTLHLEPDAPRAPLAIKARVSAFPCKEFCFAAQVEAGLTIPVSPEPPIVANRELFERARAYLPAPLAQASHLEGSSLSISREAIGVGEQAEVTLTLKVKAGHHVQDRDPGNPNLIASRLFVESLPGLEFDQQRWPEPHVRDMPYFGKVREQSGVVTIRVPFKLSDPQFPSGPVALRVLFTYQACADSGVCFAPAAAEGVIRFTAATPNPPAATPLGTLLPAVTVIDSTSVAVPPTEPVAAVTPPDLPAPPREPALEFVTPQLSAADWEEGIPWQRWRPGLAEELARRGYTVYVDYTATWCLTCQTNKLILETNAVRTKMRDLGVIPILADFTKPDPLMKQEIDRWAPTVPVNVVYAAGHPDRPAVLPTVLTRQEVLRALENPLAYRPAGTHSLWLALLGGLLGGLLLNVMPCVLPVISIKVLSFVQQAGEDPRRVLRLGLVFCAGIMVWFWAFALLASAGRIPWQHPEVVIALSCILFVLSLNLFGVFEINLPGTAADRLDAMARREGYSGAFLKGLLATLLGTACTAPFLAGAMAYALTQPRSTVFLVFTAAGAGMALPYVLLSIKPAWLKFMPKPGPWMVTFKQATAFVLLGTVVWLLWILADQLDAQGVVWTVGFLGFMGLAAWMFGRAGPGWAPRRRLALWAACATVAVFGFWFCYVLMYDWGGGGVV